MSHNAAAIETLFVDVFLEAHRRPPAQIILDLTVPRTIRCTATRRAGSSTAIMIVTVICRSTSSVVVICWRPGCGGSNIDGAAGAIEEVARIVAQIRRRWPKTRVLLRGDSGFAP